MLHEQTIAAFFDELEKIAADGLLIPAVGANSAAVDGPGVKPFTKQRGYRRLSTQIEKDAGIKDLAQKTMGGLKRVKGKVDKASITAGVKITQHPVLKHVAKAGELAAGGPSGDASDMRLTPAIQAGVELIKRLK